MPESGGHLTRLVSSPSACLSASVLLTPISLHLSPFSPVFSSLSCSSSPPLSFPFSSSSSSSSSSLSACPSAGVSASAPGRKYSIVCSFSNELVLSAGFEIDTPDAFGRTCLHAAAAGGNVECVKLLLSSGADCSRKDKCGRTPLHYAAASRHYQCLELLVSSGTCVNAADQWGRSALHYAAASDLDRRRRVVLEPESEGVQAEREKEAALCLEFLLQSEAEATLRDRQGYSAVHYAAAYGHRHCLELVRRFPQGLSSSINSGNLATGADSTDVVDAVDSQGQTPLMLAVAGGHGDAVSVLLEREASVDIADSQGRTALHIGLLCGQEECVQCLLEQEAAVCVGDAAGRTPLHLAAAGGHASCLNELLNIALSEGSPPFRDNRGYTPLHWACYSGHESCVEVLLEQKACRRFEGNPFTPLHCAVMNNHEACASMLLDALGSDIVNCSDAKGRTPLHAAAFMDHVDCLQLLLSHGASGNAVDQSGRSAVMMGAEQGSVGAVGELVGSAKANLSLTDHKKNTALHLACSNGQEQCALLILEKLTDPNLINAANAALQTPLHLAARSGLKHVVQELLSRGASVQLQDENGLTPALACAPNREVADCLALILATMMPFCSPCSSGAPSPGSLLKAPIAGRGGGRGARSPPSPAGASGPPSEGQGDTTENDSDSETF
nr:PREDICTED: serine/threonine-protein phosphatase 6 regulatory ankyrin repeat subunit B [Lepisosteus oculatus]